MEIIIATTRTGCRNMFRQTRLTIVCLAFSLMALAGGALSQQPQTGALGNGGLLHLAQSSEDLSKPAEDGVKLPLQVQTGVDKSLTPQGGGPRLIGIDKANLRRDLSPWGMFLAADIVVQGVMVGLAVASVAVWTVWLTKSVELWLGKRCLRRALSEIRAQRSLDAAEARLDDRRRLTLALLFAAREEHSLAGDDVDKTGIKERVSSRLAEIEVAAVRSMRGGLGLLASIGATAPFVGLFGTVWGIMNSFIGISRAQTTNLAVVAPGIAEALLATAMGLVAAIPAVILYNQLTRTISSYRGIVRENASEVERILSRQLDYSAGGGTRRLPRAAE